MANFMKKIKKLVTGVDGRIVINLKRISIFKIARIIDSRRVDFNAADKRIKDGIFSSN